MTAESLLASSGLLDMISRLLDESMPEELFPEIAKAACLALKADAAVLEIPAELADAPFRYAYPSSVAISLSAVERARGEKCAVLWNLAENADVSKSIAKNNLTSILVAPFKTPAAGIVSGFLYLQREARTESFDENDKKLFDGFVCVLEKIAASAYNRKTDRESLDELRNVERKGPLVYASRAMAKLVASAEKLVALPAPLIIRGETGTGKEVLAKWIHARGPRADRPFVAVNCGAIPENLIESILFGHVKGSFTGAIDTRKGVFEEAEGGTLFLDEIGELPLTVQVKLLRVLQERHIVRVGDSREIPVNVRVISATHVDLERAVKERRFREDLYYRVQVMSLEIPPLRERGQDVLLLAHEFLKRYAAEYGFGKFKLSRAAEKALLAYPFPGNVRELENKVQRAIANAEGNVVLPKDLGLDILRECAKESPRTLRESRELSDRAVIDAALRDSGGNLTLASAILGIDRKVLREMMERLEMRKEDYKKRNAYSAGGKNFV